ncbi:MAG: aldo/keto reductase [Clostridiales bacterium]|nr:aldo/keto reductase [Candidatus Crickella caballi]
MIYNDFCGENISRLGFGLMRLPLKEDKSIDQEQVQAMVDYAMANGVNYFDTAWPYHGGKSELSIGEALAKYPRESWFLANKFPGHQTAPSYDPAGIFEKQLAKCKVDYFDFYLLHNINEGCFDVYKDERWGIVDYFVEQTRQGRIRHLGFSTHARAENLEEILDYLGDSIEFCQIQMNYLDWTLQEAKEKYEMLTQRGIPTIIMESVRGGKLADLGGENNARLKALRPDESITSWALRWLQQYDNCKVILSGMSNLEHMKDNVATFSGDKALTAEENELLLSIADEMKDSVPCTGCRYCVEGCPMGLDIPMLIKTYNDAKVQTSFTTAIHMEALPEDKRATACIGCGSCTQICPQKIDVPDVMSKLTDVIASGPSWAAVCEERAKQL